MQHTKVPLLSSYCNLQVSKWIKTADLPQLENAVYMGRAAYMLGRTAWNDSVRDFLATAPNIAASIEEFHSAAAAGEKDKVDKALASDRRLIASRDQVRSGSTFGIFGSCSSCHPLKCHTCSV